jgi:hypothetical protein
MPFGRKNFWEEVLVQSQILALQIFLVWKIFLKPGTLILFDFYGEKRKAQAKIDEKNCGAQGRIV